MSEFKSSNDETLDKTKSRGLKPRKFQAIVYALGLVLALVSFTEFYYGNVLQNQIEDYEKKVEYLENLRENVLDIEEKYTNAYYNLIKADLIAFLKYNSTQINMTEADLIVTVETFSFYNAFVAFAGMFLQDYENKEIKWLFTKGVFNLYYNDYPGFYDELKAYFNYYEDLPNGNELDDWIIWLIPADFYWYSGTHPLFISTIPYYPIDIAVDIVVFDDYVNKHYFIPLNEAKGTLITLQISTNANTIGILILGFLLNFEDVSGKWKVIYVLLATVSMLLGNVMTIALFLSY